MYLLTLLTGVYLRCLGSRNSRERLGLSSVSRSWIQIMTRAATGLTYVGDRKYQEFEELDVVQTLIVLAAVDWQGIYGTVESYVGLWEVCASARDLLPDSSILDTLTTFGWGIPVVKRLNAGNDALIRSLIESSDALSFDRPPCTKSLNC